jgi:hypothetical protein
MKCNSSLPCLPMQPIQVSNNFHKLFSRSGGNEVIPAHQHILPCHTFDRLIRFPYVREQTPGMGIVLVAGQGGHGYRRAFRPRFGKEGYTQWAIHRNKHLSHVASDPSPIYPGPATLEQARLYSLLFCTCTFEQTSGKREDM